MKCPHCGEQIEGDDGTIPLREGGEYYSFTEETMRTLLCWMPGDLKDSRGKSGELTEPEEISIKKSMVG